MPTYTITGPDGRKYNVNAPEGASAEEAMAYLNRELGVQPEAPIQSSAPSAPEDYYKNIQDIINSAPIDRSPWETFTSGVSRGVSQTGSLLGDVLPALGASTFGFDDYARRQMEEAKAAQEEIQRTNPQEIASFKDIKSAGDLGTFLLERGGEQLPNIAFSLIGGGVGGAAGKAIATRAAESALAKTAEKRLAAEALGQVGPMQTAEIAAQRLATSGAGQRLLGTAATSGGTKGAMVGAYLGSYALNAPEIFQNVYEQTDGDLAPVTSLLFGGLAAGLDAILPYKLTKPQTAAVTLKLLEKSGMQPSLLKTVGKEALKSAGIEGLTEGAQEALSIAAERIVGENYEALTSDEFNRVLESAVVGSALGSQFGTVGGVGRHIREKNVLETEQEKKAAEEQDAGRLSSLTGTDTDPGELSRLTQQIESLNQTISTDPNDKVAQFELKDAQDQLKSAQLELRRLSIPRDKREEFDAALKEAEGRPVAKPKPEVEDKEVTVSNVFDNLGISGKEVSAMLASLKSQNVDLKLGFKAAPVGENAEALRSFLQTFPPANREQAKAITEYLNSDPAMQDDAISAAKQAQAGEKLLNTTSPKAVKEYVTNVIGGRNTADESVYEDLLAAQDEAKQIGNDKLAIGIDKFIENDAGLKAIRIARAPAAPLAAPVAAPIPPTIATLAAETNDFRMNKNIRDIIAGRPLGDDVYYDLMTLRQAADTAGNTAFVKKIDDRVQKEKPLRDASLKQSVQSQIAQSRELVSQPVSEAAQERAENMRRVLERDPEVQAQQARQRLQDAQEESRADVERGLTSSYFGGEAPTFTDTSPTELSEKTLKDLEEARKKHMESATQALAPSREEYAGVMSQLEESATANKKSAEIWEASQGKEDEGYLPWDKLDPIAKYEFSKEVKTATSPEDIKTAVDKLNKESSGRQMTDQDFWESTQTTPWADLTPAVQNKVSELRKTTAGKKAEELATEEQRVGDLQSKAAGLEEGLLSANIPRQKGFELRYSKGKEEPSLEDLMASLQEENTKAQISEVESKPQGSILGKLGLTNLEEEWKFKHPNEPMKKASQKTLDEFTTKQQVKAYLEFQKKAEKANNHYVAIDQTPELGHEAALDHLAGDIAASSGDSARGRLVKLTSPDFGSKDSDFGSEGGKGVASGRKDAEQETARLETEIENLTSYLTKNPDDRGALSALSKAKEDLSEVESYSSAEDNADPFVKEHFKYTGGKHGAAYYNSLSEKDKSEVRKRAKKILNTEVSYNKIVRSLAEKANAAQAELDKTSEKRTRADSRALDKALKEVEDAVAAALKAGESPQFKARQIFKARIDNEVYSSLYNLLARTINKFATYPSESDKALYFSQVKRLYQMLHSFVNEHPQFEIESKKAQDNARALLKGYQPTYNQSTVKRTIYALQSAMRRSDIVGTRIKVLSTPEQSGISDIAKNAKAVVVSSKSDPNDFQVYLFANNIQEGDELAVFLHEVGGHIGMRKLVGEANYNFLVNQIKKWAGADYFDATGKFSQDKWNAALDSNLSVIKSGKDSLAEIVARSAIQRVVNANKDGKMSQSDFNDEVLAHFIEEAVLAGVSPTETGTYNVSRSLTPLEIFFKKIIEGIKNILAKINMPLAKIRSEDIVDLAYGAAQIELNAQKGEVLSQYEAQDIRGEIAPKVAPSKKPTLEGPQTNIKEQRLDLIRNAYQNLRDRMEESFRNQEIAMGEEVTAAREVAPDEALDEYERSQQDFKLSYSLSPQVPSNLPSVMRSVYGHMSAATKNAPVWGKDFISNANNTLSTMPVSSRSMFNSLLSVNQLSEVTEEYNKQIAKKIKQVDAVTNQRDYEESLMKEKLGKLVTRLVKEYQKAPANIAEEFEKVAHDSTRYQIDFRDASNANNPLYKRFYALPKPMRDMYFDVVDAYSEWSDMYLDLLDTLTAGALSTKMKLLREQVAKRIVPYLPLYREGDFWVTYTDKNNEIQSIAYMTPNERKIGKADIIRSNDVKPGTSIRDHAKFDDITIKSAPPTGEFEKIIQLMRNNKVDPKIQDAVYRTWLDLFPSRSIRQQFRPRKGTLGERQDVLRNLTTVGTKMITSVAQMKHSRELNELFTDIKDLAEQDGSIPVQLAAKSMEGRKDGILNPTVNIWASRAGYSNYLMYILGSVGSAVMNLTALPIVTYSLLGGKYGIDRAAKAMMEATKMVFSGGFDGSDISFYGDKAKRSSTFKQEYADLAQAALARRRVGRTAMEDLMGRKGVSTSDYTGIRQNVEKKLGWIFQNSERFNREVTLLAAYKLAKIKGMTHPEAVEEALNMVDLANGGANSETGAALFQKDWGKVIGTFKRYPLTMMYLQYKLFKKAFGTASKKEQEIARGQLLTMYGTAGLFAGVKGMPLVGAATFLAQLLNGMFGDKDDQKDPDAELMRTLGFPLYNGPIGYALNIDFSRAGLGNLLWKDNPQRVEQIGVPLFAIETIAGPTLSTVLSVPRAYDYAVKGEWQKAFETVVPSFVRNISKGFRYAEEGITNAKGVQIREAGKIEAFKQGLGLTPSDIKQMYDQNEALNTYNRKQKERQTSILSRLNGAMDNQDLDGQIESYDEIDKFNVSDYVLNNPSKFIDYKMIKKSRDSHLNRLEDSVNGVYLDKKTKDYVVELYGDTSVGSLFK